MLTHFGKFEFIRHNIYCILHDRSLSFSVAVSPSTVLYVSEFTQVTKLPLVSGLHLPLCFYIQSVVVVDAGTVILCA